MEFRVAFEASPGFAISQPLPDGFALLDLLAAHKHTAPASGSVASFSDFDGDPVITLTREQAQRSGQFLDRAGVRVWVSESQLNAYVHATVLTLPNGRPLVALVLDAEALVAAWLDAGAPPDWRSAEERERIPDPEQDFDLPDED